MPLNLKIINAEGSSEKGWRSYYKLEDVLAQREGVAAPTSLGT